MNNWPLQSECFSYYGKPGENQVNLELPFHMKIAWDLSRTVSKISVHKKVYASAKKCFIEIAKTYDEKARAKLGIDLYGGCLAVRKMRGGNSWSMHSWGIAIDFDPERNPLKASSKTARLAKPDAEAFWKIWEAEGWLSLGRAKNFDWMHIQAARL